MLCPWAVRFSGDGPCTACGKRPAPSERTAARAAAKAAADTVARILEVGGPFAKDTETLRRAVDSLWCVHESSVRARSMLSACCVS